MRRLATGGMFEPVKHEVVKAERQILIGQPKEYPNELVRALKALFEKRSVVEAAYRAHFFDPSTGDPPHLLVALKLAREDRALMADAGIVATEAGEKGKLVDFMVLSGRAGVEGYFQSIEPFYRRSVEILKPPEKKTGGRILGHRWFTVSLRAELLKCWSFDPEDGTAGHSHSIVPGGLLVMSYTTRLTPRTSLTMRLLTRASTS